MTLDPEPHINPKPLTPKAQALISMGAQAKASENERIGGQDDGPRFTGGLVGEKREHIYIYIYVCLHVHMVSG